MEGMWRGMGVTAILGADMAGGVNVGDFCSII